MWFELGGGGCIWTCAMGLAKEVGDALNIRTGVGLLGNQA